MTTHTNPEKQIALGAVLTFVCVCACVCLTGLSSRPHTLPRWRSPMRWRSTGHCYQDCRCVCVCVCSIPLYSYRALLVARTAHVCQHSLLIGEARVKSVSTPCVLSGYSCVCVTQEAVQESEARSAHLHMQLMAADAREQELAQVRTHTHTHTHTPASLSPHSSVHFANV